jgi:hypothetical protein
MGAASLMTVMWCVNMQMFLVSIKPPAPQFRQNKLVCAQGQTLQRQGAQPVSGTEKVSVAEAFFRAFSGLALLAEDFVLPLIRRIAGQLVKLVVLAVGKESSCLVVLLHVTLKMETWRAVIGLPIVNGPRSTTTRPL